MTNNVHDFNEARSRKKEEVDQAMLEYFLNLPPTLTYEQCIQARERLGWSVEALAFRSGVSRKAIGEYEAGARRLLNITRQALTFAFESAGLVIIPGCKPSTGENVAGMTVDPRQSKDFHLIE